MNLNFLQANGITSILQSFLTNSTLRILISRLIGIYWNVVFLIIFLFEPFNSLPLCCAQVSLVYWQLLMPIVSYSVWRESCMASFSIVVDKEYCNGCLHCIITPLHCDNAGGWVGVMRSRDLCLAAIGVVLVLAYNWWTLITCQMTTSSRNSSLPPNRDQSERCHNLNEFIMALTISSTGSININLTSDHLTRENSLFTNWRSAFGSLLTFHCLCIAIHNAV